MSIRNSISVLIALTLSVVNSSDAVDARPIECAGFPNGCTCTTTNVSVGSSAAGELRYNTVVATVSCDGIGLTEVPDFSNHTNLTAM